MADLPTQKVEPTASPLPPRPDADPLTASQWRTLLAIADAVVPDVKPKSVAKPQTQLAVADNEYSTVLSHLSEQCRLNGQLDVAKEYLSERPSVDPAFRDGIWRYVGQYVPGDAKAKLTLVLSALDTRAGALFLTGYPTAVADQPIHIREQILLGWQKSRLPIIRMLAKSLTVLAKRNWLQESASLSNVLNFPRIPAHGNNKSGYPFEFIQFTGTAPTTIETDVVIVGSGCGAGVSAKTLTDSGNRVIVVERAYHWASEHFPMRDTEGFTHLFMNGGGMFSDDSNMAIVAGEAFGGGGTVNWSASLQTQGYVRREWAAKGMPFFTSPEFQSCLDRVCDRMGVSADHIEQNPTNRHLLEGARKLGWAHKAVPQNTGGTKHYCGYCTMGCGSCEKQGPMVSYLPEVAAKGAQFIEGFDCQEVLFETIDKVKTAVGVKGIWTSRDENGGVAGKTRVRREVIIRAKRVIVSGGTMQSPLLLLRSGLKNYHIGRNLKTHPVSFVGAVYPEETRPWEGGILTAVVNEFENLDGQGHGTKLEATTMLPSLFLGFPPWRGGLDFKLFAAKMKNMVGYISLARDFGSGQVYPDSKDGRARYKYLPHAKDKRHITEGLVGLAKIAYVEGATEIFTAIPSVPIFQRAPSATTTATTPSPPDSPDTVGPTDGGINDPAFNAWLDLIRKAGLPDSDVLFLSAHQMGTCRMGASPKTSVVDPHGKVWGTEGLYVADASVFPSASGVNPMITNMAIADWISRGVARGLKRGAQVKVGARL